MKVIFLDVDGVLNSGAVPGIDLNSVLVHRLLMVVEKTDAKVVLSSTWRLFTESCSKLGIAGIKFIGCTPNLDGERRGTEIEQWLRENPSVEKYAIIDDDSDMLPHQKHFNTDYERGLTAEIANAVIEYLNAP